MANKNGNGDPNKALMIARGSKTGAYDCDAPDQWKFNLRHGEGEVRAMAWIQSKTIALGHKSPYCVDEHGKPVTAKHMALELGLELQTAKNILGRMARQGRIRIEKGKRIWYCAEVPYAHTALPKDLGETEEPEEDRRTEDENKSLCQSTWTTYLTDFIENMPLLQQGAAKATLKAFTSWKSEFLADGMAALRATVERFEDSTYRKIGIPKKRLPKRRPVECKWVQLSLLAEPDFVQNGGSTLVQNGDHSVQTEKGSVQSGRESTSSLLYSSSASTSAKTLEAAAGSSVPSVVIEKFGNPPPPPFAPVAAEGKAEEEDLFPTFQSLYPKAQFDGPKAKPAFLRLKPDDQRYAIDRLRVYLESERWLKTPQYIPWASNWLRSDYSCEPPACMAPPAKRKSKTAEMLDEAFGATGD